MNINSPCYICKKRIEKCHTSCDNYLDYKLILADISTARIKYKNAIGITITAYKKSKRG